MTLNKTDRIVITLGKQIVHGKYVWHRVTSGITSTLTYCNGCWKMTTTHGLSVP